MSNNLAQTGKLGSIQASSAKDKSKFIVNCYQFSQKNLRRLKVLMQMCLDGFWLGILTKRALYAIDESYYTNAGTEMYCNEKYNEQGLFDWEKKQIESFFNERRTLLVLAAGGGREVYELQTMGYKVDAFECHPVLLDFANQFLEKNDLTPCVRFVERDAYPVTNQKYEGTIVGWSAYMLMQSRQKRIEFLQSVRRQMDGNAPVLISFFTREKYNRVLHGAAFIANVFRFILVRERVEVGDYLVPNFVHYFTREEIEAELREAGFKMEFFSASPYGHAVGVAN